MLHQEWAESFVKCRNIEIIKMPWALRLDIILQRWLVTKDQITIH